MKKIILFSLFRLFMIGMGMPAAHGLSGKKFGEAVSGLEPGAISEHVSSGRSGEMPSLHSVDGKTFGGLVSGLAKSSPRAIADHVR